MKETVRLMSVSAPYCSFVSSDVNTLIRTGPRMKRIATNPNEAKKTLSAWVQGTLLADAADWWSWFIRSRPLSHNPAFEHNPASAGVRAFVSTKTGMFDT